MGKSRSEALASGRRRAPAWLAEAGGALASIVLPARVPVLRATADWRVAVARVRGLPGLVSAYSGKGVSGVRYRSIRYLATRTATATGLESCSRMFCQGCRSEKFHFRPVTELCEVSGFAGSRDCPFGICRAGAAGGLVCGPAVRKWFGKTLRP